LVADIARVLQETGCIKRVYVVPFGDYQREIAALVPPELRVIMYRRLMFKVAEALAHRERGRALVTGESLGKVASQTLDNIAATDEAVSMPVFRPLIGTNKQEIIKEAKQLGTFDISSQDAPDCCTLFMPRNPETHARLHDVLEAEEKLPLADWIPEILAATELLNFHV
jgi:thiamine biosynthesis protein ThiI